MVAITVIIGVIMAQFVFGITERFSPSASATFDFQQNLVLDNSGGHSYTVTVRVINMQNSDYLAVRSISSNDNTFSTDYVGDPSQELEPADDDDSPDSPSESPSIENDDDGAILLRSGDKVTINELDAGDTIQIYGSVEGEEMLVSDYTVRDVIPEAHK